MAQRIDLRKKATTTPPAARPSDIMTGKLAPAGGVVDHRGRLLTETEVQDMLAAGLDPSKKYPANLAEILTAKRAKALHEHNHPPTPAGTGVLDHGPIPEKKLTEEEQAQLKIEIEEAEQKQRADEALLAKAASRRREQMELAGPMGQTITSIRNQEIENLDEQLAADAEEEAEDAKEREEAHEADHKRDVGLEPQFCPHCSRSLHDPAMPMPTEDEKKSYLLSLLSDQPYSETVGLYGGKVYATLRVLTVREVNAIAQALNRDRLEGRYNDQLTGLARVAELRVALQLQRLVINPGEESAKDAILPDGLSKSTNRHAESTWEEVAPVYSKIEDVIDHAYNTVYDDVLSSETLARVVGQTVEQFNRRVIKLEQVAQSPNF